MAHDRASDPLNPAANEPTTRRRELLLAGAAALSGLPLAGCGGGGAPDSAADASAAPTAKAAAAPPPAPKRLRIDGRRLLGPNGSEVKLHGVNLQDNLDNKGNASTSMLTAAEAQDIAVNLRCNFVRLRISLQGANLDANGAMSQALRTAIEGAWQLLSAQRVWMLFEMRTDDDTANSADLYTVGSAAFEKYAAAWLSLAQTYGSRDYVAGYGLLAEPSPDKTSLADPVGSLIGFQAELMRRISVLDGVTPFFIGPAYNYDTMGYRWPAYYTDPRLQPFRSPNTPRLVYEVNCLMPKPWIQDGSQPPDPAHPDDPPVHAPDWPLPAVNDFSPLTEPYSNLHHPQDDERIFTKRRQELDRFPLTMASNFPAWYLQTARLFAEQYLVPMVVDQFGASTLVNTARRPAQQLRYEQAVITAAEESHMGWSRWIYNGNPVDRAIVGNADVVQFYVAIGAARPGP